MLNTRSTIQEQREFLKRRLDEQKEKTEHDEEKNSEMREGNEVGLVN